MKQEETLEARAAALSIPKQTERDDTNTVG